MAASGRTPAKPRSETSQRKSAEQQAASLEKEREALSARLRNQNRLDSLEREKGRW
jgi:hypothetical protein